MAVAGKNHPRVFSFSFHELCTLQTWNLGYLIYFTANDWLACEPQTHFRSSLLSLRKIGGREATTGNASAVRRLMTGTKRWHLWSGFQCNAVKLTRQDVCIWCKQWINQSWKHTLIFVCDWLRKRHKIFQPITERGNTKPKKCQKYLQHFIEIRLCVITYGTKYYTEILHNWRKLYNDRTVYSSRCIMYRKYISL